MPNGRDGKIVSKYTPNHFLLSREMQKTNEVNAWNEPTQKDKHGLYPTFNDEPPDGVKAALDEGLRYILPQKRVALEERFGKGSADWIINNLKQFTTEEKYRLHDMFNQFPTKVDGTMVPHTGEQIRTVSPITGVQG